MRERLEEEISRAVVKLDAAQEKIQQALRKMNAKDTPRLCKDCKHAYDFNYAFDMHCQAVVPDYVFGKRSMKAEERPQTPCSWMRQQGPCGPEGYLWELKDA